MKRYVLPVVIVAAAFAVMSFMSTLKKDQKRGTPPPFVRTVTTRTAAFDSLRPVISSGGRVRATERVDVAPEVSGVVLDEGFRMRKGISFSRGSTLLKIDPREALFTLHGTISDLRNALSSVLPELKIDVPDAYERWALFFDHLAADHIPPLPRTSSTREKLLLTRFQVFKLYYSAKSRHLALEKHTIRAPFSGTVEDGSVFPSSTVRAGVPVGRIVRTDRMEVELALTPDQARLVKKGATARVRPDKNPETIEGVVDRVSEVLDERMQTVPVFVRVDNAGGKGLRSGAYVTVAVEGGTLGHALRLPRKALHNDTFVYVIEDGRLREKKVEPAFVGIEDVYVAGGIDDGAVVIVEPVQDAVIGMRVQPAQLAAPDRPAGHDTASGPDPNASRRRARGAGKKNAP